MIEEVLLLGAGNSRNIQLDFIPKDSPKPEYVITTLDFDPDSKPDILWDLEQLPLPLEDSSFDSIHAYEVLEHTGTLGDWKFFFNQFNDFWRILRPGGKLVFTVPAWNSEGAWGDPSHKRVINKMTLAFLSQEAYAQQVGVTVMSDFRRIFKGDFDVMASEEQDRLLVMCKAIKPARSFA